MYPFLISTVVVPSFDMVAVLLLVLITPCPTCPRSPPPYTEPIIFEYVFKKSTSTFVCPDVISAVLTSSSVTFISSFKSITTCVVLYTVALTPFPPPNTFNPICTWLLFSSITSTFVLYTVPAYPPPYTFSPIWPLFTCTYVSLSTFPSKPPP